MVKLQLKLNISHTEEDLKTAVLKSLKCKEADVTWHVEKRSVDARDKSNILYVYSIVASVKNKSDADIIKFSKGKFSTYEYPEYVFEPSGELSLDNRPVIIGCGPAGLFATYMLSQYGYKPLVLERGYDIDKRTKDVDDFWKYGTFNKNSNVQFGEGGAGTFSDGKLNTGVKDKSGRINYVLKTFVDFGADSNILISNKPHIGTDTLKTVIKAIREECMRLGATFRFGCTVKDIKTDSFNNLTAIVLESGEEINTEVAVLAIGHSARDTFEMLSCKQLLIEPKPFAIGLRIEHLQETIGLSQYGEAFRQLPAADYKMTYTAKSGRGVYSFCMCPGGYVVNASSEEGRTVVNGMSYHDRSGINANSAIVVQINPEDFLKEGLHGVLAGVEFQRKWEENCYRLCGGAVPVQRFADFCEKKKTSFFGSVTPETKGHFEMSELSPALPYYVRNDIEEGIKDFDRHLKGFSDGDAILSGVETRTSSPVRIVRDENYESMIKGLYPCGEGAGYAGGIMSAAVDGIKVFEKIALKYKR